MKNINILPNTIVPKKIRLELYQQAYQDIINDTPIAEGLCVGLPLYLWGLECYDIAPNGEIWKSQDTPNMFPELKEELEEEELEKSELFKL